METIFAEMKGAGAMARIGAVNKFNKNITMTVQLSSQFRARVWIAKRLFRMAAWVLGCGLKFDDAQLRYEEVGHE